MNKLENSNVTELDVLGFLASKSKNNVLNKSTVSSIAGTNKRFAEDSDDDNSNDGASDKRTENAKRDD
jgi:hypothetical protein